MASFAAAFETSTIVSSLVAAPAPRNRKNLSVCPILVVHPRIQQRFTSSRCRNSRSWKQVSCSYSGVGSDFSSAPIDVVAEVRTEKILVLGGSGFVGSEICKQAVKRDIEVVSISRSGRPSISQPWVDKVLWISGDVFMTDWYSALSGCTAVISTLGGFGTNEQMLKINGDANIAVVDAASKAGVPKFIYVSVHEYNLPEFLLSSGYFQGKKRAEQEIFDKYPSSGTILRPGFIYGKRRVNGVEVPLDFVGQPLEKLLAATETFTRPFSKLPASDLLLAPPVSVTDVALAALKALKDDTYFGTLSIEQIKEAAAALE
ncbi:hypothetical protein R1flu_006159 [Riccia fluitans]|uniref:NAD(P)-binding domain-containing protein n=1 Tax=Riccia fluitans TaxID=41844 RepID=A0ABD1YVI7_9MARC